MKYKILLMGPQGSGKGTQAEILSKQLGIPALSMGQLIRDEIASESDEGKRLKEIVERGDLISDQDAAHLLQLRLNKPDTQNGYILDGYPRNREQYQAFNFDTPTHVLVIEIPREESLKRLGGRLTCKQCGKVGALSDGIKPGDLCACGGEWYQRADDTPEAIARRLKIYEQDTQVVIEHYGDLVHNVDGSGSIEETTKRLMAVLT
jgi:adenylate kinase